MRLAGIAFTHNSCIYTHKYFLGRYINVKLITFKARKEIHFTQRDNGQSEISCFHDYGQELALS